MTDHEYSGVVGLGLEATRSPHTGSDSARNETKSFEYQVMRRALAYLEGSDPGATSGGERNYDLRVAVRKVLEASK